MIQKLRKKFVLVNMLLVSGVLLVVFGAVCFFQLSPPAARLSRCTAPGNQPADGR